MLIKKFSIFTFTFWVEKIWAQKLCIDAKNLLKSAIFL